MFLQNSRIDEFRVALRAAEWFFISVHVFDVVFISAGFMDLESKSDKSKSEFLSNGIPIYLILRNRNSWYFNFSVLSLSQI